MVYWYGSYADLDQGDGAWSFYKAKDFLSAEKGKPAFQKHLDLAKKKQKERKDKLFKKDANILKAAEELEMDLAKEQSTRHGKIEPFLEVYEYYEDQEDVIEEDQDPKKKTKTTERKNSKKVPTKKKNNKKGNIKRDDTTTKAESKNKKDKINKKKPNQDGEDIQPQKKSFKSKKRNDIDEEASGGAVNDNFVNDVEIPKKKMKKMNESGAGHGIGNNISVPKKKKREENGDDRTDGDAGDDIMMPPIKQAKTLDERAAADRESDGILPPGATDDQPPEEKELSAYDEYILAMKAEDEAFTDDDDGDDQFGDFDEDGADDENFEAGLVVEEDTATSKGKTKTKRSKTADGRRPEKKAMKKSESAKKISKKTERKSSKELEQEEFENCEEKYLDLLERWEKAITKKDSDMLLIVYDRLLAIVKTFSAPFMEVYDLNGLMKRSKAILNNEKRKEAIALLRSTYNTKKDCVPAGFEAVKKAQREEKENLRRKAQNEKPEESEANPSTESTPKAGKDDVQSREVASFSRKVAERAADRSTSKNHDSSRRKSTGDVKTSDEPEIQKEPERKKKFSLGNLMKSTSTSQFDSNGVGPAHRTGTSNNLLEDANTMKWPPWTATDAVIKSSVVSKGEADEERELGLAFLDQSAPFVPPAKNVHPESIARALEAATFEFAVKKDKVTATTTTSSSEDDSHITISESGDWVVLYWDKIHALSAALSGKDEQEGTLARMIAKGDFDNPHDVVKLSDDQLWQSYNGKKVERQL